MDHSIFYSVIIVCLNAGKRLAETIDSIASQDYDRYEVIVKDGGSTDGSLDALKERKDKLQGKIHVYTQQDTGIYDAMNQAVSYAKGEYLIFLNAGDSFYDEEVLSKITDGIKRDEHENGQKPDIVYGNLYHKALQSVINASPVINDFTCYRNVPCHQTCFYRKELFYDRGYNPHYNVRADYEHFLWCFYEKKAQIIYLPVLVAAYEGGGYSETAENRKRSAAQHKEITKRYMGAFKAWKYRMIMLMTLAPLRTKLAQSQRFSGFYNKIKSSIYTRTKK